MKKILTMFILISSLCFADRVKIIKSESLVKLENEINYFVADKEVKNIKIEVINEGIFRELMSIRQYYSIEKFYVAYIIY